jgi:hypothetical protein
MTATMMKATIEVNCFKKTKNGFANKKGKMKLARRGQKEQKEIYVFLIGQGCNTTRS